MALKLHEATVRGAGPRPPSLLRAMWVPSSRPVHVVCRNLTVTGCTQVSCRLMFRRSEVRGRAPPLQCSH